MKLIQILLISLCLMAVASAHQQPASPSQGQPSQPSSSLTSMDQYLKVLSEKLGLTADQIAKIKPILQDQLTQMQTVRKDSSLTAGQKLDRIHSLYNETQTKIRGVLTDDQKKKFDAMPPDQHSPSEGENPPPK
jgi:Spy/CpxP family protein refolding chaperone